jgi:hypothetical protein
MRRGLSAVVAAAWLLTGLSATAHHSFSAEFDINRPIALTGTVSRVEWTNPHAWIFVETEDGDGNAQIWAVELLGINALMQRGMTRDSIKPGDIVSVDGFGARDGSTTANASSVTSAESGERIWASSAEDRR